MPVAGPSARAYTHLRDGAFHGGNATHLVTFLHSAVDSDIPPVGECDRSWGDSPPLNGACPWHEAPVRALSVHARLKCMALHPPLRQSDICRSGFTRTVLRAPQARAMRRCARVSAPRADWLQRRRVKLRVLCWGHERDSSTRNESQTMVMPPCSSARGHGPVDKQRPIP